MLQGKVTITGKSVPCIRTGCEAGYPGLAYIFNWATKFKIIGVDAVSSVSGEVVQKVEGCKKIYGPDDELDLEQSMNITLWESFRVSNGVSERLDMIQLVFYPQQHTCTELTLSASYHQKVTGTPKKSLHPEGEVNGAENKLLREPSNYLPTLVRKIKITTSYRDETSRFNWIASLQDQSGTGKTTWQQREIDKIISLISI